MSVLNIVECESYQIKVKSPDIDMDGGEIIGEYWKQVSHDPIQLGSEFDTFEQALAYAEECMESDAPTCQRLFHGGYVICGNIYMAEQIEEEDGEFIEFIESTYFAHSYKGEK